MKYNIIGDIHGRDCWKTIVRDDAINVFLGDYLDPYIYEGRHLLGQEWQNLQDILRYKKEHPETVLLLGNHDLHYMGVGHCSRYNEMCAAMYGHYLEEHIDDFQLAYTIGEEALLTHAGVTRDWLRLCGYGQLQQPSEIAAMLNGMLHDPEERKKLGADFCFEPGDFYGMSATASPIWVRPEALLDHNALPDKLQIVGHTQMEEPIEVENVCFCDILGTAPMSTLVELPDDNQTESSTI